MDVTPACQRFLFCTAERKLEHLQACSRVPCGIALVPYSFFLDAGIGLALLILATTTRALSPSGCGAQALYCRLHRFWRYW